MINLFSSFDPQIRIFLWDLNWISSIAAFFFLPQFFWISKNQIRIFFTKIIKFLFLELEAIFGNFSIPGIRIIFLSYFFFIIFSNFLGLFPFIFTSSRHLRFSLSLSLPLWLGSIVWSLIFQINRIFRHLVPLGTPVILIPVIVLIETVRSIIRPGTLRIRLTANIVAGHLLLTLLGRIAKFNFNIINFFIILSLILLLILECAVACIQSYVFIVLNSLYINELLNLKLLKKYLK